MRKKILLVDSLGALASGLALLVVPQFEEYLGIPKSLTILLLPFPLIFSLYSLLVYMFSKKNWRPLLKVIAVANLLYCGLTLYYTLQNTNTFTSLGIAFFVSEMIIILTLVIFEFKIALGRDD